MTEYLQETNEEGIDTFNGDEIPRNWKIFNWAYSLLNLDKVIVGDVEQLEHQRDKGIPREVVVWDRDSQSAFAMSASRYNDLYKMK